MLILYIEALWPVSLKHTTPAINSVIYFAYPTGIAIISIFVLNKRYRWVTWAANGALVEFFVVSLADFCGGIGGDCDDCGSVCG